MIALALSGCVGDDEKATTSTPPSSTDRVLATVMLTDIVGSTERAAAIGDATWRTLRERHDSLVRQQLPRFGGRELKQTGDGFLAVFDGPARAVDCPGGVREAIREIGVELRIGIHTGECELIGDDITGMAVKHRRPHRRARWTVAGARIEHRARSGRGVGSQVRRCRSPRAQGRPRRVARVSGRRRSQR